MEQVTSWVNWVFSIGPKGQYEEVDMNAFSEDAELVLPTMLENLPTDHYLWVHLNYDHPETLVLLEHLGVPENAIDALLTSESRPKAVLFEDAWLIMLRAINMNPNDHPELMISLRLWIAPKLFITMRRSSYPLFSIRDLKAKVEAKYAPISPIYALLELAELLTCRVRDVVDGFEDSIAQLESTAPEGSFDEMRTLLSTKRREAASIRRFLTPQREALEGLSRHRAGLDDDAIYWARDLTERTTRYIEDLDLVREKATVLQEDMRATISDQQNQRMYVLSIVTALFLPLSFLTGVFGMNVAGLPGTGTSSSFWFLSFFMVVVAVIIGFLMRWKNWF